MKKEGLHLFCESNWTLSIKEVPAFKIWYHRWWDSLDIIHLCDIIVGLSWKKFLQVVCALWRGDLRTKNC